MKLKIAILIIILSMTLVVVGSAYTDSSINRQNQGNDVNPATTNSPLFQIDQNNQYYAGQQNLDFIQITNNYDETETATIELSNDDWSFSDGSTSKSYILDPGETIQTEVNIGGSSQDCSQKQMTYSYTYSVNSSSLNVQQTSNSVTICGSIGGGPNKAPVIEDLQGYSVDIGSDQFNIDQIQVSDKDGNLELVTYTFTDDTGSVILEETRNISGQQYQSQQLTFNSPVDLVANELYSLKVVAQDTALATDTATRTDSVNNDPIRIVNFQDIKVQAGPDQITIGQAEAQDNDGDLSSVKFEVYNSGNTLVAENTQAASGQQYQAQNIKFTASTDIKKNQDYTVRMIATDSDGDTAVDEVTVKS